MAERTHRPDCPTVNSPLAGSEVCTCPGTQRGRPEGTRSRGVPPPPTPQLDKVAELRPKSEEIGAFVAEWLPLQGIVPAQWVWVKYPCPRDWTRKDGELVAAGLLIPESQLGTIDLFDCPCAAPGDQPGPHMRRELWAIGLHDDWINGQVARYFGLDPSEIERERSALLSWVRATNKAEG